MSLLEKASLVVTPNGYKAGKLYSVIPNTALGDLDVVRATTATRVNSAGLIESVGLNVPRIDYTNGSCPSILVEPQRTNLLLNSATVATQTITTTAVATTVSFYGTGTITFSGTYIGSLVGTGANNRVTLTFTPTAGSLILTVVGSCTKGQLEVGSYPTSYIPTVANSETRNVDIISKTGISSLIGQTEGTIFIQADNKILGQTNRTLFYVGDSTANNFITVNYTAAQADTIRFLVLANGGVGALSFIVNTAPVVKIAVSYKNGVNKIFINGLLIYTQTGASFSSNLEGVFLGNNNISNEPLGERIDSLQIYKTELTNAECISLTTP
jgi:hypothetical protein